MDAPHMDPAVVVVQQSPPHHAAHPAAAAPPPPGPPPPPHPAVTTAMLSNPAAVAGINTQTFTNQIFMPPTTLAAMQQAAHAQHAYAHAQQQQQQQHPADPRPAPGFAGLRPPPQPMQPMQPQQPAQQQPQVSDLMVISDNPYVHRKVSDVLLVAVSLGESGDFVK